MEELLFGGIRMEICQAHFRVSTDSMVLADFCRIRPRSRVLDLGCGCGTLSLLALGAHPDILVDGVEIQPEAAQQARENASRNALAGRMRVICGDLRQPNAEIAPGSYNCVISNPPYYPLQSGRTRTQDTLAIARSECCCTLAELCSAAARALTWGGRFFLVHKPERLTDLLVSLRQSRLEPKRIRFVRHQAESGVSLVLLEACLGGRPGLQYEPDLILYNDAGQETAACRRIYHRQE